MKNKIRIMVVDDHFVVRVGLAGSINAEPDMILESEASTAQEAVEQFRKSHPDVVLMDLTLSGPDGVEATRMICQEFPEALVIMLSTHDGEEHIYRSLQAGARTYLVKTVAREELIRTIRAVHAGQRPISPAVATRLAERITRSELTIREVEILKLIAGGNTNKEIGSVLEIAEVTVKIHVGHILAKLNASDRTQATTIALQRGIIHL